MYLDAENFERQLDALKKRKKSFTLVETHSSSYILKKIDGKNTRIYRKTEDTLEVEPEELHIFAEVQKDARRFIKKYETIYNRIQDINLGIELGTAPEDLPEDLPILPKDRQYFNNYVESLGSEAANTTFMLSNYKTENLSGECYEIDLVSAYARYAYKLGIISKRTLNKLNKASKNVRLMAFGSLATVKKKTVYINGKIDKERTKTCRRNQKTRSLFFYVARKVSETMQDLLSRYENIYCYWVDAVFVPSSLAGTVMSRLARQGIKANVKGIYNIKGSLSGSGYCYELDGYKFTKEGYKKKDSKAFKYPVSLDFKVFNRVQELERKFFKKYKDINEDNQHHFQESFSSDLAKVYNTDNPDKINKRKITAFLNSKGLYLDTFLRYESKIKTEYKKHYWNENTNEFKTMVLSSFTEYVSEVYEEVYSNMEDFYLVNNGKGENIWIESETLTTVEKVLKVRL